MCFVIPPIIAGISAAMSAVGTAVSAVGSIAAGQQQKAQADAQAKAYRIEADQTQREGQYQADRIQEQTNQAIGSQTAQVAGSGVTMTGSPTDVIGSTASSGALDRSSVLYNARANADRLNYQARLAKISGQNAVTGSVFGAAGTLFSGLGQAGKTYLGNPFGNAGSY